MLPLLVVLACGSSPATTEVVIDGGVDTGPAPVTCPTNKPLACGQTCVNPGNDPDNCGKCGEICSANTTCSNGECCAGGLITCPPSTACSNLQTDPQNCGACNSVCGTGQMCVNGACVCPTGDAFCAGACVNEQTDANNCGACGTKCPPNFVCSDGMCALTCASGLTACANQSCVDTTMDPANCGGCAMPCPQRPNATAACAGSNCNWSCLPMYVDLDGDLNVQPRTAMSDGCECHVTNTVDIPDLTFTDKNCDGIVGDVNHAIFVSPRGDDSQPGTMTRPMKTLAAAIAAAEAAGKDVYAALGTYSETVNLVSGVNLFGGYDDTVNPARWGRALGNTTIIQGSSVAVVGANLTQNTQVQLFTIQANAGFGPGASSYGVQLYGTAANVTVTLRGDTIVPSDAAGGAAGVSGGSGSSGGNGTNGANGGAGGTSSCSVQGGNGGAAVCGSTNGVSGQNGSGVCGGSGGQGTSSNGSCCGGGGTNAPGDSVAGCQGTDGTNGAAAPANGTFSGTGGFVPGVSHGGVSGTNGSGGGGGGSGSGDSDNTSFCFCISSCCSNPCGGAGGGGGAGGCGGTAGSAATGGGASIAVVAINTNLVVDTTTMNAGHGGAGGSGGNGGLGGGFGIGGTGQPSQGGEAGAGAAGQAGGRGGHAGSGSGAPGGPSSCLVYSAAFAPTLTNFNCSTAGGGAGGAGGSNAQLGQAPSGAAGQTANTIVL